jgi:hypothetical protein
MNRSTPEVLMSRIEMCRLIVLLTLLAGVTACDARPGAEPIYQDPGNVHALMNASMVFTDTGFVVNGTTRISHPGPDRALWMDRFERFDNGGFPELGYEQSTIYSLVWRLMLTHEHPASVRGDSTLLRFVDHGNVTVQGVGMEKFTDVPYVAPGVPIRFTNFVRYLATGRTRIEWLSGGVTDETATWFGPLALTGGVRQLTTSGSAEATQYAGWFWVAPFASLQWITSGPPVPLRGAVPVVSADRPLAIGLDRVVDASTSFIVLAPVMPGASAAGRAFIQPVGPTSRITIPSDVLRALVAPAGEDRTAYRLTLIEIHVQPFSMQGTLVDPEATSALPFVLPLVQRSELTVHLYLQR